LVGGKPVESDGCGWSAPDDGGGVCLEVLDCVLGVLSAWSVDDDSPPACGCSVDPAVGGEGFGGVVEWGWTRDRKGFAHTLEDDCG
jgi:hypothetical protein